MINAITGNAPQAQDNGEFSKNQRCVIIGGAEIRHYDKARARLRESDFFIFCDSGLRHASALGMTPDLIIGDFDSHENPGSAVETIVLPHEKDDTDSFYAAKEGLRRGFSEFLLLGCAGGRLDHTLGNLSILLMLDELGKHAMLLDDYSEMEIISHDPAFVVDSFPYFSLLNISGTAKGICVENAKFPLENAEINCNYAYGISNEVLPGMTACISVREGSLLLIRVFKE